MWNRVHPNEFVFQKSRAIASDFCGIQTHKAHGRPWSILFLPQCFFSVRTSQKHRKSLSNCHKSRSEAGNQSGVWKKTHAVTRDGAPMLALILLIGADRDPEFLCFWSSADGHVNTAEAVNSLSPMWGKKLTATLSMNTSEVKNGFSWECLDAVKVWKIWANQPAVIADTCSEAEPMCGFIQSQRCSQRTSNKKGLFYSG